MSILLNYIIFQKKFQIESFLGNFLMTLIVFSKKFNFARETKQETKPVTGVISNYYYIVLLNMCASLLYLYIRTTTQIMTPTNTVGRLTKWLVKLTVMVNCCIIIMQ